MEYGMENIYIKKRKGFIKYALQHGYVSHAGPAVGPLLAWLDWDTFFDRSVHWNHRSLVLRPLSPSLHTRIASLPSPQKTNRYTLALGYSFGESDNYHTLTWAREWRMQLLKKTKILAFLAWGQWWCPFLPVRDHPLNTVVRLSSI